MRLSYVCLFPLLIFIYSCQTSNLSEPVLSQDQGLLNSSIPPTVTSKLAPEFPIPHPSGSAQVTNTVPHASEHGTAPSVPPSETLVINTTNRSPLIESLTATPNQTIPKTGKFSLSVKAIDPDKDNLRFTWGSSHGLLSATKGDIVEWRPLRFDGAFETGQAILLVAVDDNQGGLTTGALNVFIDEDGSATYQQQSPYQGAELDYIEIQSRAFSLQREKSLQLSAKAILKDGSQSNKLYWFSLNPESVTVSQTGLLKRIGAGEARILILSEANLKQPLHLIVAESASETTHSPSNQATALPGNNISPTAPEQPQALNITTNSITLNWNPLTNAQSYNIYQNGHSVIRSHSQHTFTLGHLSPDSTYSIEISANNPAGESSRSPALVVKTEAVPSGEVNILPVTPLGLTTTQILSESAVLQWQLAEQAQTYKIYVDGQQIASGITHSSYVLTGLKPNTQYGIQISSANLLGESAKSSLLNITTGAQQLKAPTGLRESQISDTGFQLQWNPVEGADFYKIYKNQHEIQAHISGTHFSITGLSPATSYQLQVSAVNALGESTKSAILTIVTGSGPPSLEGTLYFQKDSQIHKIKANGTSLTALANGPSDFHLIGQTVVYSSTSGNSEVYKANLNNGSILNLTNHSLSDYEPVLSPSGQETAFISDRNSAQGSSHDICIVDNNNLNIRRLTTTPSFESDIAWSPNGEFLIYESERDGNNEIYRIHKDGGEEIRLTQNSLSDLNPRWSPDGQKIAYIAQLPGRYEIYTMNLDGTGKFRITNSDSEKNNVRWSPDGKKLLFETTVNGKWHLFTINADGTQLTQLTQGNYTHNSAIWSPNQKFVAYASLRNLEWHLYLLNVGTREETHLIKLGNDSTSILGNWGSLFWLP